MRSKLLFGAGVGIVSVVVAAASMIACTQTPTTVPVRTFERAQRVDTLCLEAFDDFGVSLPDPRPVPLEQCSAASAGADGVYYRNHLYAVVTQSTRGEVAVVDITSSAQVDQQKAIPGINFLPVGALPTDVAATPDSKMVFVGSAEVNKPAIYGIPGTRVITYEGEGNTLRSWPVCALPQNPGALTVVPRAGAEGYDLVAVLPGDRQHSAKVVTIDPQPFLRGSGVEDGEGARLLPGELAPCPITAAIELVGAGALPTSAQPGDTWGNGLPWVDGGVDLACERPLPSASCGTPRCCPAPEARGFQFGGDAAADAGSPPEPQDAGACSDDVDAGPVAFDVGPLDAPRLVSVARRDQLLYVADANVPLIHVVDLSVPSAPRELAPLLATNELSPSRAPSLTDVAVSPPTRDYKRFLYAVDKSDGSILIYDVTDPNSPERTPLRRPNPELNPFQPPDRLAFGSPVVAVTFARHDFPLTLPNVPGAANAYTGVLCNPNPAVTALPEEGTFDPGYYYRRGLTNVPVDLSPARLRGVFALATLASGQVYVIDVDDWDAPCRRPSILGPVPENPPANVAALVTQDGRPPPSSLLFDQPNPSGAGDLDAYHVPYALSGGVSNELFSPAVAPHQLRSGFLLSLNQNHVPLADPAQITTKNNVPLPLVGPGSESTPRLGVAFSYETAQVHVDQRWSATYEGALPGFDGFVATITTDPKAPYTSLTLSQGQGRFCSKGIEDAAQADLRAEAYNTAAFNEGLAPVVDPDLGLHIGDYVSLTDDILPIDDPYWTAGDHQEPEACWATPVPAERYDLCARTFGAGSDEASARDLPILEAYDGKLVVGRFYTDKSGKRTRVGIDPSNVDVLKRVRCCFHDQVRFKVRTGGVWALTSTARDGSPGLGFLNHVVGGEGGRCTTSCEPRESLLNGRIFSGYPSLRPRARDSALVARNPMFAVRIDNGSDLTRGDTVANMVTPARDTAYVIQTRGQFVPLTVNLAPSNTALSPQSMRFLEPLGQVAVVDAATQGLVLIDLSTLTLSSGSPYY